VAAVDVTLEPADIKALARLQMKGPTRAFQWMLLAAIELVAVVGIFRLPHLDGLAMVLAFVMILVSHTGIRRTTAIRDQLAGRYTFERDQLVRTNPMGRCSMNWAMWDRVIVRPDRLLLAVRGAGVVLPRRCFVSQADYDSFAAAARERVLAANPTAAMR
jgi:hypothetical protein